MRLSRALTDSLPALLLGLGSARGLRPARLDLDPEIQVLAAEERRSGSRGGGPGSEGA